MDDLCSEVREIERRMQVMYLLQEGVAMMIHPATLLTTAIETQ